MKETIFKERNTLRFHIFMILCVGTLLFFLLFIIINSIVAKRVFLYSKTKSSFEIINELNNFFDDESDEILLDLLGALFPVGAHGDDKLHVLALGVVRQPLDEGHDIRALLVVDQLVEVVNEEMGNIIIPGMETGDEAFQKFVAADGIAAGVDETGLIGNVVSELAILLNDDHVAVALDHGLADQADQLLRFAGPLQSHDDLNHNDHTPF